MKSKTRLFVFMFALIIAFTAAACSSVDDAVLPASDTSNTQNGGTPADTTPLPDIALAGDVYSQYQIFDREGGIAAADSYFADALMDEVMKDLLAAGYTEQQASDLLSFGGLTIHTTLDPKIQRICDEVFSSEENYPENVQWYLQVPQPQASITIADQATGHVLAMIGGRGEDTTGRTVNRAVTTKRQPGVSFMIPAVYAPALDYEDMTLATVLNDAPFHFADGEPVGNWWGGEYRGLASYRDAIRDSMNVITVKALTRITPELSFAYLKNFGFSTLVEGEFGDATQFLALGGITDGVTNLEMNAAYAAIAGGGTYHKPKLYTKIVSHDGTVLLDNSAANSRQVIRKSTAFLLTSAMIDVVESGTGRTARFADMTIAGKTATTASYNDIWFVGYTPYYTATVWSGHDNHYDKARTVAERQLSQNLWRLVMEKIHEELPDRGFSVPDDIVLEEICSQSGKLPLPGICEHRETLKVEFFAGHTVPDDYCNVHYQGKICKDSQLPASESCSFQVSGELDLIPPEDKSLWAGSGSAAVNAGIMQKEVVNGDDTVSIYVIRDIVLCPHG